MAEDELQDFAQWINDNPAERWTRANGVRVTRATRDEVRAEMEIRPEHLQSYGIVHGGVHCALIETIASIGAAIHAIPEGKSAVGLENHTSFLRAVRSGRLRAVAKPLTRGRRSHVWEGSVYDDQERLVASGRVRLLILEPDTELAGKRVEIRDDRSGGG
ncbi:MAG TPA: PaaI family thioesterase [Myxococcaceae bacterium]|nr:PaaI family thioesterase [Myxococcaceae bacterium]